MDREQAARVIRESSLARHARYLESRLRPSVRLCPRRTNAVWCAPGESRFGGSPDLPANVPWPTNSNGTPLSFLAQLALTDVSFAGSEFAMTSGWLSFFYEANSMSFGYRAAEYAEWKVIHVESDQRIERREPPGESRIFNECRVEFRPIFTLPRWEALRNDRAAPFQVGLASDSREVIPYNGYEEELRPLFAGLFDDEKRHRFLGHPLEEQGPMEDSFGRVYQTLSEQPAREIRNPFTGKMMMQRPEPADQAPPRVHRLLGEGRDWRLLLQLDSDRRLDWMWHDAGCLYFWMPGESLRRQAFDDVWLQLQCG